MINMESATSPRAATLLIIIAVLATALGIYQWFELVQLRTGDGTLLCSINATFNCASIWNSSLADAVHKTTRIPVVAWGVIWSLIVLILSVLLLKRIKTATPSGNVVSALRLTTGIGAVVVLGLLAYSISLKTFCPTCVTFYVLVAAAAYLAFSRVKTGDTGALADSALMSGGLLVVLFVLALYPGLKTPRENLLTAPISSITDELPSGAVAAVVASPLEKFLTSLPHSLQQGVSDSLVTYRNSPLVQSKVDPKRLTFGPADAPVHMVEWTDIRCPHCRHLEEALIDIRKISAPGSWSEESRHFPLDSTCNSKVSHAGDGTSCVAAQLEICLIGSPDFARVRQTMFERQTELTKDLIWEIASTDPERRKSLQECANSPATAATLKEDTDLAEKNQLEGTPLVVINGRKATALPAAILGLIMAKARDDDPAFLVLPAPSLPEVQP